MCFPWRIASTPALILGIVGLSSLGQSAEPTAAPSVPAKTKLRVGAFDSRAIAIAWVRSKEFDQELKKKIQEKKRAEAAGDRQTVEKLMAEGRAGQAQIHLQGFGGVSVTNLLEKVQDQIPALAREAGVDVIVSKWDLVYQAPDAEFVDVTALMVRLFPPNPKARPFDLQKLGKTPLVPLDQLKNHQDY